MKKYKKFLLPCFCCSVFLGINNAYAVGSGTLLLVGNVYSDSLDQTAMAWPNACNPQDNQYLTFDGKTSTGDQTWYPLKPGTGIPYSVNISDLPKTHDDCVAISTWVGNGSPKNCNFVLYGDQGKWQLVSSGTGCSIDENDNLHMNY